MKPSTAKAKGADTESKYVEEIKKLGILNAERRHLSGAYDKGDVAGWVKQTGEKSVCVEVKSGAQLSIPKWLSELAAEVKNSNADVGFVVVRPKGKPQVKDWFIVMPHPEFIELMREAGYMHD